MPNVKHRQVKTWDADRRDFETHSVGAANEVYQDTEFESLAEAIATIIAEQGDNPAILILTTKEFPDGDRVVVPETILIDPRGEGSIYITAPP